MIAYVLGIIIGAGNAETKDKYSALNDFPAQYG